MAAETSERVKGRHGSARRAQRPRTMGPVPTFVLFAPSPEPVKVPLLPLALSGGHAATLCQKRKGADHDDPVHANDAAVALAAPEPKHARLDESLQQKQQPPQQPRGAEREKDDSEAAFDAILEVSADEGRRIYVEEEQAKAKLGPRPSIHPDEIKILEEEQHQLFNGTAGGSQQGVGGEVTIDIADGSSPEAERPSAPEAQRHEEHDVGVKRAAQIEAEAQDEEEEGEEVEQEEAGGLGSQQSQIQPNARQGGSRRRRNRGKGKNRSLRRQGTQGSRLTYR
jgi:hypothetical protein